MLYRVENKVTFPLLNRQPHAQSVEVSSFEWPMNKRTMHMRCVLGANVTFAIIFLGATLKIYEPYSA